MVEYNKINCELTNVQLNKLKKADKSNEGATLRLGIKNFNKDELPHELLLTTRQNTKLRNAINNNSASDIKLSKAQIKKLIQSGGLLGKLLSKLAGPLMKVALPLAKNVLAPLGLTATMSAIDGSIQKKIHGSGVKLIIEQEDMNDIMKIIEPLQNFGILLKGVSKTIENETKEQRGGFLGMLLGPLGASLLGNLLTGGKGIMRAGDGILRAGSGSKKNNLNSLLPFHPLTNIEINEYYKNEPRFNGVYSRNNLPNKIKKGAYIINLDEYENTGTHWVSSFVKTDEAIYFGSFGVEHIPKEINRLIGNKKIKASIFRIQAYDSIMCGYFCIEFINYMLKGKTLLDYTNLFSPNDFKKNDRVIKRILKMNNIIESTNVNKYRLDEINKIRDYFNNEIKERKDIIKKLYKYFVSFDYLDKIFITLSASFSTLSIASYASVVGTPAGIVGSSLTLIFTIGTGISKSLLKVTKKRKKKHNKIIALAKNKLNTIDTLLSSALNDTQISHEEFSNIITEANIYESIKENIKELTTEPSSLERTTETSTTL